MPVPVIVSCLLMNDYVHRWETAERSVRKAQHHYSLLCLFSPVHMLQLVFHCQLPRDNITHGRRLPQLYLVLLDYYNKKERGSSKINYKITCVLSFGRRCDGYLPYISPCKYSSDQSSTAYMRPKRKYIFICIDEALIVLTHSY